MSFVTVTANKTLGAGDDGVTQLVNSAATITIPNDATYNYVIGDKIYVYNNTASSINIGKQIGVSFGFTIALVQPVSAYSRYTLQKTAANTWIGWVG